MYNKHVGMAPELFFGRKVGGLLMEPPYGTVL